MNQRPTIFKVQVALEGSKYVLKSNRYLQKYIDKCGVSSHLIVFLPQPKAYEQKKRAQVGKVWECQCGVMHPAQDKDCGVCGDRRQAKPYARIEKEFGNMRILE